MEIGVLLGVGSALAFGAGDFTGGSASRHVRPLVVAAGAQAAGLLVLLAPLLMLRPPLPSPGGLALAAGAGLFGGTGLLALYRGLSLGSMGIVTAISGVGSVLIPLGVSAVVAGAAIGGGQWVGVGCALAAAAAASGATLAGVDRRALGMATIAALGFGIWFVLLDAAASESELWTLVASRAAATLALGALALASARRRARAHAQQHSARPRGIAVLVGGAGILDVGGNAAFVFARATIPVGIAAALSGIYPIITMLLARGVARESLPRLGVAAVLLAVAGIVLISLG